MAPLGSGCEVRMSGKKNMQKSLSLLLIGCGLLLAPTCDAFAKADILPVNLGSTTPMLHVNSSRNGPAGHTDRAAGGAHPLAAASHQAQDGYATATFNMSGATLAGALTLLLLQRRHRVDYVLRPRH
jgi:hypothetical protein